MKTIAKKFLHATNIGVARGGQGRAFARPSLIFALPLKSCQSK